MRLSLLSAVVCALGSLPALAVSTDALHSNMPLRDGWTVQSACKLQAEGAAISATGFHPDHWYATTVPSTVLATQVASGEFKDPYFGKNLRNIPGANYPIGHSFAELNMPPDSPYYCGWWYRREFAVPAGDKGKTIWLHFGGINYRADVWVNGKKIADKSQVAGVYRTYNFDVTGFIQPGKPNVVAVETFAPVSDKDLGINWVDWNPCPPDKDMGLWGTVDLETTGPVSLRSPMATTHFTDSSLQEAQLTVYAELHNSTDKPIHGDVTGTVANVQIEQAVDLAPHEDHTIAFTPERFPQLRVKNPRVWWPWQMGAPNLETLTLRFVDSGKTSDEQSVRFGIREMTSELTDKGYRLFRVNDKPILVRGAGWSQDMLLREDPARLRDQFRLVRDMHLNTIRLEGKMETEDFFQLADEQGILVMLGWCCCDQWEHWKDWTPENYSVAAASLRSQMLRIRHHASLLVWLNGSDNAPPAFVESAYLKIEEETHWPNPTLSAASSQTTQPSGKNGVKMAGPYDWVDPSYWYVDTNKYGGAYGFATEISPGPAIPSLASLKKFIPSDQIWPQNADWAYHFGGGEFTKLTVFDQAMNATYGQAHSAEDYVRIAQTMSYDSERAMYEAYGRNKYTSTGVIQWMLNNAWPSMIWHLYDYYLEADGGYFGTKKACEPLHIQYSYDDHSVVVVNSLYQAAPAATADIHLYDVNLKTLFSQQKQVELAADSSVRMLTIPANAFSGSKVYFVDLSLKDAKGTVLSRNFYWIPAKLSTFDWAKTDYTHTPASAHEDMTALLSLPKAAVEAQMKTVDSPDGRRVDLLVHNPTQALAFQVSFAARTADGNLIAPVFWSDNYIELLPGESRTITATLPKNAPRNTAILISGWNVATVTPHAGAEREMAALK